MCFQDFNSSITRRSTTYVYLMDSIGQKVVRQNLAYARNDFEILTIHNKFIA